MAACGVSRADANLMASQYRITVTGASGTGKTTVASLLAVSLGLPLIPEIARQLCLELGYKRIGEIPDQEGFKKQVLQKQIEEESKQQYFVADRGALDCWVLWQRWNICTAMTFDTEFIYEKVKAHLGSYTQIIYIPPAFEASSDEFRWTEPDYIKQIDRLTRMSLFELSVMDKVYTVKSDRPEKRLAEIQEFLSKH